MVTGTVGGVDSDGDPLTFTAPTTTLKGTVSVSANGSSTYTPNSSARHTASALNAADAERPDSFIVSVRRSRRQRRRADLRRDRTGQRRPDRHGQPGQPERIDGGGDGKCCRRGRGQ